MGGYASAVLILTQSVEMYLASRPIPQAEYAPVWQGQVAKLSPAGQLLAGFLLSGIVESACAWQGEGNDVPIP